VAMFITGPWSGNDIRKAGVKFGVTYLPGQNGDHQSIAGPDFWSLLDHKDPTRAHWSFEFVKWLTDPAQDTRWSKVAGSLPLRASEENTPEWRARVAEDPSLKVFFDNLRNCKNMRPSIQSYTEVSQEASNALIQVLVKGADPKKALDDGAAKADVALDG